MADAGLSLSGLTMIAAGAVLAYAGINDAEGGPIGVVTAILRGETPKPGLQLRTEPTVPGLLRRLPTTPDDPGEAPTGDRGKILSVAKTYLGVPYRLGGQSRSGIDCSGLVLVAYRDGAGIKLPHRATLQAARGRRVDRSEILPGDLVAWGVPGNYPHIALAINGEKVIVAPTWGKPVQYQKLWEKKVPGFGYPDIIRILQG